MAKIIAMIPARSQSKRIPNKNIKDFLGKPIITYPIETAKESRIFDYAAEIYVYTDDAEIGELAVQSKVNWAKRKNVSDYETLTETALDFIEIMKNYYGFIDYLCVLLPTAVFVDTQHLLFNQPKASDCSITFCKYSHPTERQFHWCAGKFEMQKKENEFIRTQDCSQFYYDAGQMYFFNVKSFLEQKRIFMENIYPIIIDAVDIDDPEDWKKAEAFYQVQKGLI